MQIKFFLYNSFLIESGNKKIAIDPGGELYFFNLFKSIIPEAEWKDITHIFVTHGDPDHHWYTDRVVEVSHAPVICNRTMVKGETGKELMLSPRRKGLAFKTPIDKINPLSEDETIELDGMRITGIKVTHGSLTIKLGPFSKTLHPGPEERIGLGALGFKIELEGKILVNLGDTLLLEAEWQKIKHPDLLMLPIGGGIPKNTMDEGEALQAVKIIQPKLVIPTHYNLPAVFSKNYNTADDQLFKREVEKLGVKCIILHQGDAIDI